MLYGAMLRSPLYNQPMNMVSVSDQAAIAVFKGDVAALAAQSWR